MENEKLPIGTVVKINNKDNKYIILGRNILVNDDKYDYVCAIYPYGISDNRDLFYINDNEVNTICHLGNINY